MENDRDQTTRPSQKPVKDSDADADAPKPGSGTARQPKYDKATTPGTASGDPSQ